MLSLITVLNQPLRQGFSLLKTLVYLEPVITAQTAKCPFASDICHSTETQFTVLRKVFHGSDLAAPISEHLELVGAALRASECEKWSLVGVTFVLLLLLGPINILIAVFLHPLSYAVLIIHFLLKITVLDVHIVNVELAVLQIENLSITPYFFSFVMPRNMAVFSNSLDLCGDLQTCDAMFQVMSATFWSREYHDLLCGLGGNSFFGSIFSKIVSFHSGFPFSSIVSSGQS